MFFLAEEWGLTAGALCHFKQVVLKKINVYVNLVEEEDSLSNNTN